MACYQGSHVEVRGQELVLHFHHVSSRVQSQVFRLGGNTFTLEPSHQLLAKVSK